MLIICAITTTVFFLGILGYLFITKYSPGIPNIPVVNNSSNNLIKFKTGIVSGSAAAIQSLIIKKQGIDKKYGLDIEYVETQPGDIERELSEGKYNMGVSGILFPYTEAQKGVKLKVVFPVQRFGYDILVPSDSQVSKIQDLKGKKLGVLHKTTGAYTGTFLILKSLEGGLEKSVQLVFGSPQEILDDLNSGEIEAATVAYPFAASLLSTGKFKSIVKLEDLWREKEDNLPMPFVGMLAQEEWLSQNQEIAKKIAHIYFEAAVAINEDPSLINSLTEYLEQNKLDSPKARSIVQERVASVLFQQYGEVELVAIERYYQKAKEYGFLPKDVLPVGTLLLTPDQLGLR